MSTKFNFVAVKCPECQTTAYNRKVEVLHCSVHSRMNGTIDMTKPLWNIYH